MSIKKENNFASSGSLSAGRYYELLGELFEICPEARYFPLIQHLGKDTYDIEHFGPALCQIENIFDNTINVLKLFDDNKTVLPIKDYNAIILNEKFD